MASCFSKKTALTLFCFFRQAERSIDYALSCPNQWVLFEAYYDEPKRARIADLIEMLKAKGACQCNVSSGRERASDFLDIIRSLAGLVFNPFRHSWLFSGHEISFFSQTLEHLLTILQTSEMPEKERLINLRLNCFDCKEIIRRKLIGVPELRAAAKIEHFNQSEYGRSYTFQELGIYNS